MQPVAIDFGKTKQNLEGTALGTDLHIWIYDVHISYIFWIKIKNRRLYWGKYRELHNVSKEQMGP